MCFETLKENANPIIADRDLYVVKIGFQISTITRVSCEDESFFISQTHHFIYYKGEVPLHIQLKPEIEEKYGLAIIKEGYHSYHDVGVNLDRDIVGLFVIPKGTELYINENGDVMSSTINFISELNKDTILRTDGQLVMEKKEGLEDNWYTIKNLILQDIIKNQFQD